MNRFSICATSLVLAVGSPLAAQPIPVQTGFPQTFPNGGGRVVFSSVVLADLTGDGLPEVIVGGVDGRVQAFRSTGAHLWTFATGSMAVASKPSVADIDGDGFPEVIVTTADATTQSLFDGGVWVLNHLGQQQCRYHTGDFNNDGREDGVYSTVALADLDRNDGGRLELVFNGWDGTLTALNDDCSVYWSLDLRETTWSSVAVGDVDLDGFPEVVAAVGTHFDGPPYNTENGGMLHVFRHDGSSELSGFPIQLDEVLHDPVLADLDGDHYLDIVVGIGRCWDVAACAPGGQVHPVTEVIYGFDRHGNPLPGWPVPITGQYTGYSPAVADLDGDQELEIVFNTIEKVGSADGDGWVYVVNGDGSAVPGWPTQALVPIDLNAASSPATLASAILADLTSDGEPEIIIPLNWEIVVFAADATQLTQTDCCPVPDGWQMISQYTLSSTPAVADLDGDGDIEIVAGGTTADGLFGRIHAWDMPGSYDPATCPWPQLRRAATSDGTVPTDLLFYSGFENGSTSEWDATVPAP